MFEGEQTDVCVSILDRELTTAEERHFAVATRQQTNNAALGTVRKYIHVNSFKETRQSKQLHPKTTPFFLERKNELSRAGFKPATFCVLGKRSTN